MDNGCQMSPSAEDQAPDGTDRRLAFAAGWPRRRMAAERPL